MYKELLEILKKEVKPALGCTAPVAIAFAAAAARNAVGGEPERVFVRMDKDTYKNTLAVGIPGTSLRGNEISAALGALAGDASAGMEVLKKITPADEKKASGFLENTQVEICWEKKGVGLWIEAAVKTSAGTGKAVLSKTHTNIVFLEENGRTVIDTGENDSRGIAPDYSKDEIRKFTLSDLFDFSMGIDLEEIAFLSGGLEMNLRLAEAGLQDGIGAGFGRGFASLGGNSMVMRAKSLTAAASDARMAGYPLPAMCCATSGNVGITAMLPLFAMAEHTGNEKSEILVRAVAFSCLLTILMKSHIGRLSALCACAIAAGIGVAGGASILLGGDKGCAERAIRNISGALTGVVCDGAKYGCALKLSSAAGLAIESAQFAEKGIVIPGGDGLVCDTGDETMAIIGRVAREGMVTTSDVMAKIIIERENGRKKGV